MTARASDAVLALISGLDVVNNAAFIPGKLLVPEGTESTGGPIVSWMGSRYAVLPYTRCNGYVTCCTAALGCPIAPMKANEQAAWLLSPEAQLAGWMHVDRETARQRAESGYPTVAAWANPAGHGHIALVVPADPTGPAGIYVSAAGAQNYVRCLLERSFGVLKPDFFTHN